MTPRHDTAKHARNEHNDAPLEVLTERRRVKDAPTRLAHGLLAVSFLIAYLTSDSEKLRLLHVTMGYLMLGLLAFRLLYGIAGPRYARLQSLWTKVVTFVQWLRLSLHQLSRVTNPQPINWTQGRVLVTPALTAVMLALIAPIALSGYLTFNSFGGDWGEDLFGEVHELLSNSLLFAVSGHLSWLLVSSVITKRNEAAQMWSGLVRGKGPDLVQHNRVWLAVCVALAAMTYICWEWSQSPRGLISWSALF